MGPAELLGPDSQSTCTGLYHLKLWLYFYFISQISFTLSLKAPLSKIVLISSIEPVVLQPVGQLLSYFPVKRSMGIYCYAPGLEDPCPAPQQTDQGKASRESLQLAFIADKPEICTGRNFCALSFCLKIICCVTKTTLEECCLKTYGGGYGHSNDRH